MDGFFKALRRAGVVLAVYAVFFLARAFVLEWRAVRLDTVKPVYLHYEFIELRLRTRDLGLRAKWSASPPSARVTRGGALVPTVAGIREVPLRWDGSKQAWLGRWPCPWNAPDGPYSIELLGPSEEGHRLRSRPFHIVRRVPKHLPPRFAALTWESVRPLASLTVQSPDGTLKDWRGLLDWVEYAGADAFWMLAGQSPGHSKGETWVGHNLALIPEVAKRCRRRGAQVRGLGHGHPDHGRGGPRPRLSLRARCRQRRDGRRPRRPSPGRPRKARGRGGPARRYRTSPASTISASTTSETPWAATSSSTSSSGHAPSPFPPQWLGAFAAGAHGRLRAQEGRAQGHTLHRRLAVVARA